jgi:hypothetical protein
MRWIVPLLIAVVPVQSASAETANTTHSDRLTYVLLTGGDGSAMMSGSSEDIRRARSLQAGNAPLLYVRQNGAAYVIRDPAILRRAETIMQPQRELGKRQGELGRQQGALGRQQGELGRQQGELGRQMADARVRELGELGRQMGELGRRQAALGEQQAVLGRQQAALGREQARLAELAQPKFRALVDEAIRRGLAQRLD